MTTLTHLLRASFILGALCFASLARSEDAAREWGMEAAREALVRMVADPEWGEFKLARHIPQASVFKQGQEGLLVAGPWSINLKEKLFGFNIATEHFFFSRSGKFVRDEKKVWSAVVLQTTRN